MPILEGGNIANIERVKIVTIEPTPKTYVFETVNSAVFTAVVSQGTENELRTKDTIHGLIRTEDLTKGYDVDFSDRTLLLQVFALIDGGTYTPGADGAGEKYAAPVSGAPVKRTPFDLYLYTSDRDTDGEALAFHEWKFPSCKGKPVNGNLKDGDFATNEYKAASRPPKGVSPMGFERIEELPAVA